MPSARPQVAGCGVLVDLGPDLTATSAPHSILDAVMHVGQSRALPGVPDSMTDGESFSRMVSAALGGGGLAAPTRRGQDALLRTAGREGAWLSATRLGETALAEGTVKRYLTDAGSG